MFARLLTSRPPDSFVEAVRRRGVDPVSVGRVIIATWSPHESAVAEAIRESGLDLQVIFNKCAVMVLPSGVDKATGLAAALDELGLSPRDVVAVGDAENDQAFLALCGFAAAVANALPALKERATSSQTPTTARAWPNDRQDHCRRPRGWDRVAPVPLSQGSSGLRYREESHGGWRLPTARV